MNAFELFASALRDRALHDALMSGVGNESRSVSFGGLDRRVDHIAAELRRNGLKRGDRVLLTVPVSVETYVVMLALLKAGQVVMVIDPGHGASRIASILRSWPPAAVIGTRSILLFRFLVPELRRIPIRFVVNGKSGRAITLDTAREASTPFACVPRAPADSALLTFTSGSTGEPKPVIRSHGFLRRQMEMLQPVAGFDDDDVDFVAMPMFVLFNLANGITSVVPACDIRHPGRADSRIIAAQLQAAGATRMVASPALLERLADCCICRGLSLPALRTISTGGGPVRPGLPRKLKRVAPDATVRMVYGSTEAEPIAAIDDHEISVTARRMMRSGDGLLVGKPVAGCAVRIIDSQPGAELGPFTENAFVQLSLPAGSIGEIVVSGTHVLSSYADASRNTTTKIGVDGETWHRTGDAGYFDEAGRLWLVGRCSAAISDSAGTVYPFQVEYAMSETAGVRRAALTSRAGKRVLVLETRGREFDTECSSAGNCIAAHGIDRIVSVRHIPVDRRHDAKVDYPALHRLLDGRWASMRLTLAETISSTFRRLRQGYRGLAARCHSHRAGSKVDECRFKTH